MRPADTESGDKQWARTRLGTQPAFHPSQAARISTPPYAGDRGPRENCPRRDSASGEPFRCKPHPQMSDVFRRPLSDEKPGAHNDRIGDSCRLVLVG